MLEIKNENIDWLMIRQALSLALLKNISVRLSGGQSFLLKNPRYRQVFDDMALAASRIGAGELLCEGESIIYSPQRVVAGKYGIASSSFSSAVELLLFLMPGLFYGDFRTIIDFEGVTHSVLSYPTAFIKESFLKGLERMGFYASLTLKRFGFYGSGGGIFESRVYPHEEKPEQIFTGNSRSLSGATIYFSHLGSELAIQEKRFLCESLGIDQEKVAIIDVMESDGPGNSIQVYADIDGMEIVFFREAPFFNEKEEIIFNENSIPQILKGLAQEINEVMSGGALPDHIFRELCPYVILCGSETDHMAAHPSWKETKDLVGKFLKECNK